jgi:hypothetical protein
MLKDIKLMKTQGDLGRAERLLRTMLGEVPFLERIRSRTNVQVGNSRVDLLVTVRVDHGERRLLCQVKASGQPRLARQASLDLRAIAGGKGGYPVFIAPYISEDAAHICEEYGVGYVDFAGNCRLTFDHVHIRRQGYPNPTVRRRDLRSLYSPKAERILRVLLTNGRRRWKTQELATEADVSFGQVANVKRLLADREWIDVERDGLALGSFEQSIVPLLNEWSSQYRPGRNDEFNLYGMTSVPEIEASLTEASKKLNLPIGFTGFSGASRLAPAVRYQKVTAYVLGEPDDLAAAAGLKLVNSGANAALLKPYDEGVLYGIREIDQAPIVSPVQMYLDLQQTKGRGQEAASALLEEVIRPLWR